MSTATGNFKSTLALALAGLLAAPISAHAADLSIRFAWYVPAGTATSREAVQIAKNIKADSGGKIEVKTYPAGTLATESTMAQALANNTANMGVAAMHWWSSEEPALAWDTIPFLTNDVGQLLKALHGKVGQDVNAILNRHGVQVIGWGFYGYAESYLTADRVIHTPKDLKGLKMRSEGKLNSAFLKQQAAVPVAVDAGEVYTALQRGTLDGAVSGLPSFVSHKWYEAAKHVTAIHYVPLVYPIQANLNWWKGLSDAQRKTISDAIAKTETQTVDTIESDFNGYIATIKKSGDTVYRPTKAELATWKADSYEPALKAYLAQSGAQGKMLIADLQAALGTSGGKAGN